MKHVITLIILLLLAAVCAWHGEGMHENMVRPIPNPGTMVGGENSRWYRERFETRLRSLPVVAQKPAKPIWTPEELAGEIKKHFGGISFPVVETSEGITAEYKGFRLYEFHDGVGIGVAARFLIERTGEKWPDGSFWFQSKPPTGWLRGSFWSHNRGFRFVSLITPLNHPPYFAGVSAEEEWFDEPVIKFDDEVSAIAVDLFFYRESQYHLMKSRETK